MVHLGDDFFSGRFPFVDLESGGSVEGLTKNIGELITKIPAGAKLIPGHGPISTVDDLKAYALEAAAAGPVKPSSRQLGDWLWNEADTGAAIHALRAALLHSEDQRLKLIAENFIVPGARVRVLG